MTLSRRDVLRLGAFTLAAKSTLSACTVGGRGGLLGAAYIDAHAHIWTDDFTRYPLAPWAVPADMKPATFTAEELLAVVKPHGVERVVLIQHAPLHGYDNSYILDCAREYPGIFSVVAMINERTPDLHNRLRFLRDAGARGIRIGPTKHADRTLNVDPARWLDAPGMQSLWRSATDLGVAVCPLLGPAYLGSLDLMCEKNPETVCVIDHIGHINPNEPETVTELYRLARHRHVFVKLSAFYKFLDGRPPYDDLVPMIRGVIDAFGPDRLMWASDLPYQLNNNNRYIDAVALFNSEIHDLSSSDRYKIMYGTAERVFFSGIDVV